MSIQAQIISLLKRLARERGAAVMLVTHDMGVIAETCDRVAVMYAGRIAEMGPVHEVIHQPAHPVHAGLMGSPAMDVDRERLPDRRCDATPERHPARLRVQPALPAGPRARCRPSGPNCCDAGARAPPAGCTTRAGLADERDPFPVTLGDGASRWWKWPDREGG